MSEKAPTLFSAWKTRFHTALERFVPPGLDVERRRRAQLFIAFSLQGVIFGLLFAAFYLAIGHVWGAAIVLVCTMAMGGAPWIVRGAGLESAGNIYAFVLVAGFAGLTAIEGGIFGHAVAWLAVVPLCTCILVDQRMGRFWCGVCLLVMGIFCGLEFAGVRIPRLYPAGWETTITSAGFLSLTVFMATVGIFFERGRRHSLQKLNTALDALSEANERLSDLDRERRAFLGMAAHDLRSPLNSIMGFARLLQDFGPSDEEMLRDSLARIHSSSTQMRDLLDRLLSTQAIEEGKLRLTLAACDLIALAGTTLENHRPAAAAKSIVLVFKPCEGPVMVRADANATVQILDNLLSNAIKFTPRDGRVQIVLARVNSHLEVSVVDSGKGIDSEFLPHVFDRFRQADSSTTRQYGGLGLGLAIVKQLIELHGGTVRAASAGPGLGTTFVVCLPLSILRPAQEPSEEPRHGPDAEKLSSPILEVDLSLDGVRVLVVDDEADASALVKRLLEDKGASVTTKPSAAEALACMEAERFDVLISDIGMPEEDGYSLIQRVRQLKPGQGSSTPAVALTAYARSEDRTKAVLAGFQTHVTKPVEPAELLTMVASLTGRKGEVRRQK